MWASACARSVIQNRSYSFADLRFHGGFGRIVQRTGPEVVTHLAEQHCGELQLVIGRKSTHPKTTSIDGVRTGEVLRLGHLVAGTGGLPRRCHMLPPFSMMARTLLIRELREVRGRNAGRSLGTTRGTLLRSAAYRAGRWWVPRARRKPVPRDRLKSEGPGRNCSCVAFHGRSLCVQVRNRIEHPDGWYVAHHS